MSATPTYPAPSGDQPNQRMLKAQARLAAHLAQLLQMHVANDTDALNTSASAADALETSMAAMATTGGDAVDRTVATAAELIAHLSTYGDRMKKTASMRGKQGQKALNALYCDLQDAVDLGERMSKVYSHNRGIPWTAHGFVEGMSSYEPPNTELPHYLPVVVDPHFNPEFARVFSPLLRVFDVDEHAFEFYVDIMDQEGNALDDVNLDEVNVVDTSSAADRKFTIYPHWDNVHPFFDSVPCAPGRLCVRYTRRVRKGYTWDAWPGGVCVQYFGGEACIPLVKTVDLLVDPLQRQAYNARQSRALYDLQKPFQKNADGSQNVRVELKKIHSGKSVSVYAANTTQAMLRQAGLPETYKIIKKGKVLTNPVDTSDFSKLGYLNVVSFTDAVTFG